MPGLSPGLGMCCLALLDPWFAGLTPITATTPATEVQILATSRTTDTRQITVTRIPRPVAVRPAITSRIIVMVAVRDAVRPTTAITLR